MSWSRRSGTTGRTRTASPGFGHPGRIRARWPGTPGRIRTCSPGFVARGHVLVQGLDWVETEGIEPSLPQCESGVFPLDDVPKKAAPTGIEPASTLLDRQAASPDASRANAHGVTTGNRTRTGRFTASHANRYTMATINAGSRMVWVAGIEPAASSFRARASSADLHPGNGGLGRSRTGDVRVAAACLASWRRDQ